MTRSPHFIICEDTGLNPTCAVNDDSGHLVVFQKKPGEAYITSKTIIGRSRCFVSTSQGLRWSPIFRGYSCLSTQYQRGTRTSHLSSYRVRKDLLPETVLLTERPFLLRAFERKESSLPTSHVADPME